jgi:hypothetical protein
VIEGLSNNAKKLTKNQSNKNITPCSIRSFETKKLGNGSSTKHLIDSQGTH